MAERCERTELFVDQRAHCRGMTEPAPERPRSRPWFPAAFPGCCAECLDTFDEGDLIRSDGAGGWIADCCEGDDD
ncbi:hypothetical protein [Nonomuraea sp. NPDC023979]|uniref:hypothetical protein n=1 Tax=Nonomuraea sp. NPDC023979 TaxID=3154796 RepID=UPI0033FE75CD